jgi:hypothetical protein
LLTQANQLGDVLLSWIEADENGVNQLYVALNSTSGTLSSLTEDTDGDGEPDVSDAFPYDARETIDTDDDGLGDNTDPDDDNDGVPDGDDLYPLDASRFQDEAMAPATPREDESPVDVIDADTVAPTAFEAGGGGCGCHVANTGNHPQTALLLSGLVGVIMGVWAHMRRRACEPGINQYGHLTSTC